jgi:hypothetical protein
MQKRRGSKTVEEGKRNMGNSAAGSEWYIGELIMEITVLGAERNVVHKNMVLIRADSPEQAYEKATHLGHNAETSYENPKGQPVRISFRGIATLESMYEELEDGAELTFEERVGVPLEELDRWIPPKEQLGVFVAPRPGREHDPDYRSKAVVEMAVDGLNTKRH